MDYRTIIDAETWSFIETSTSFFDENVVDEPIEIQRRQYEALNDHFSEPLPTGVTSHDVVAGGRPARRYLGDPGRGRVIFFHGGSFCLGGLDSHHTICASLCEATGLELVAVDYRLAPEHSHPAQFDDAFAATVELATSATGPVILCGDSAGGNLAAAVAAKIRDQPLNIAGQVLVYPTLGGDRKTGSFATHADAPLLSAQGVIFAEAIRTNGATPPTDDPIYSPLAAKDFAGLPPTVIFTAQCDPLADDGRDYCAAVTAAGGQASWVNEAGLVHGYLRARRTVARAAAAFDRVAAAIVSLAKSA